jgi:DNA (cytosine-5)-methyltransferase 1
MKAIDLFCCAGGASDGLRRAGFSVLGIDIEDQPEYPSPDDFLRGDALAVRVDVLRRFDFIWASPPCQAFTAYKRRKAHVKPALSLIPQTRELLRTAGVLYCTEEKPK